MRRTGVPVTLLHEFGFSWLPGLVLFETDALALEVLSTFFFLRHLSGESAAFEQTRAALQPQPQFFDLQNEASHCSLGASWLKSSLSTERCCKKFSLATPQAREPRFLSGTIVAAARRLFFGLAKMDPGRPCGGSSVQFF